MSSDPGIKSKDERMGSPLPDVEERVYLEKTRRNESGTWSELVKKDLPKRTFWATEAYQNYQQSSRLSKLCFYCWCIFDQWDRLLQGYSEPQHGDLSQIQDSAENGCALCVQFVHDYQRIVQHKGVSKHKDIGSVRIENHQLWPPGTFALKLEFPEIFLDPDMEPDYVPEHLTLSVWMRQILQEELIEHCSPPGVHAHYSTKDTMALCKKWLNRCCTSHDHCTSQEKFLPTRLVDVHDEHPRLVLGAQLDDVPRYATLSHCWGPPGSPSFSTLREENLEEFQSKIPGEALSKTYLESFFICRNLGLRYIWIDSLCVIQDSKDGEDWKNEAAKMTHVYEGSFINIAASGASDGSVGCFFDRKPSWRCQVELVTSNDETSFYECYYEPPLPRLGQITDGMPLHKRGWVIQERLLSPRTLLFTSRQVF
jgi:hypothetical protein